MPFQSTVYTQPAPALEGDFCSANPRFTMLAGDSTLVAASAGVVVGRFARANNSNGQVTNGDPGVANRLGFVNRSQVVLITAWLGATSMTVLGGQEISLMAGGDFWCRFAAGAAINQKVYAYYDTGLAFAAATATPPTNAGITANTAASSTTLTVTANSGANLAVGQPVSGTGIPAGTYITALGTGTGGAGTYTMSQAATALGTGITVTATTAIETPWSVRSTAAAGELAKISTGA